MLYSQTRFLPVCHSEKDDRKLNNSILQFQINLKFIFKYRNKMITCANDAKYTPSGENASLITGEAGLKQRKTSLLL